VVRGQGRDSFPYAAICSTAPAGRPSAIYTTWITGAAISAWFARRAVSPIDNCLQPPVCVRASVCDLIEQSQFVGTIAEVDPVRGIELVLDDRSSYWLPPDARAFQEASPGEYTLRSTGQTVVDPDYICTWTVTRPDAGYSPPPDGFRSS
jgi:hypothetical protein